MRTGGHPSWVFECHHNIKGSVTNVEEIAAGGGLGRRAGRGLGPADAAAIVANQWYTGHFTGIPSPLFAGAYSLGTNGPILPTGFANAIAAPGSTTAPFSLTITLPIGGYLTVTDVEDSGDQFAMDVNGAPATAATGNPSGLVPGGQQAVGDETSVPVPMPPTAPRTSPPACRIPTSARGRSCSRRAPTRSPARSWA